MAFIQKTMRTIGATTITTSTIDAEAFDIKPLGDVIGWSMEIDFTTVAGTGTWQADGGTPAGAYRGSNWTKLFNRVSIKDKGNNDIYDGTRDDLWVFSYALSVVDFDDMLFKKGTNPYILQLGQAAADAPVVTDTGALTNSRRCLYTPQRIKVQDLPARVAVQFGVLDDYFLAVGTGTCVVNSLDFVVRYIAPDGKAVTERVKAYNQPSFTADTDIASGFPNGINVIFLGWGLGLYTQSAAAAPAELNEDRMDAFRFKRGSSDEIENILERSLAMINTVKYANSKPLGHYHVPTDVFTKTNATEIFFDVNAAIAPRVYYVYVT